MALGADHQGLGNRSEAALRDGSQGRQRGRGHLAQDRTCCRASGFCDSATRIISGRWARRGRAVRARKSASTAARLRAVLKQNHAGQKCFVNVDGCERFIEIGNLVFIQYNRDASGKLTPLPKKHVDTGTGLERIAAAMQSIETGKILGNYDIDLFQTIIHKIERGRAEVRRQGALRQERRERHIVSRDCRPRAHDDAFSSPTASRPATPIANTCCGESFGAPRVTAATLESIARSSRWRMRAWSRRWATRIPRLKTAAREDCRSDHAGRIALRRNTRSRTGTDRQRTRAHQEERRPYAAGRSRLQALRHLRLSARSDRGRAAQPFDRRRRRGLQPPDGRAEGTRTRRAQRRCGRAGDKSRRRNRVAIRRLPLATKASPKCSRPAARTAITSRSSSPRRPSIPKAAARSETAA